MQHHIGVDLILGHVLDPVPLAAAAQIPVAEIIHKLLKGPPCLRDAVVPQVVVHCLDHGIELRQNPAVHYGHRILVQRMLRGVEAVNVCVKDKEGVGVPKGTHKLPLPFNDSPGMEPVGQPGGGVGVEIPPYGVRAVGGQGLKGIDSVALGFGHLLAVFILDKAHNNDVFIGGFVKQQGGDCH